MSPNDPLVFFSRIVIVAMIVPIIAAIINRKNLDKNLKIFFIFCVVTLIFSLGETIFIWHVRKYYKEFWKPILDYWEIGDTHFLQIFAFLRDYILLGWFFRRVLHPRLISKWIFWAGLALAVISLVNYLFIDGYKTPGVFNPTADSIFSFATPMISMWYLYNQDTKIDMHKNPVFWVSLGLILPNLLGLFLFFTSDFLQNEDYPLYVNLMLFKNFFEILGVILFTIGFAHAYYMRFFYPESTK